MSFSPDSVTKDKHHGITLDLNLSHSLTTEEFSTILTGPFLFLSVYKQAVQEHLILLYIVYVHVYGKKNYFCFILNIIALILFYSKIKNKLKTVALCNAGSIFKFIPNV